MQLQDDAGGHGDAVVPLVNHVQHVAVPCDFALVAVRRLNLALHQLAQAHLGGRDVLDSVRRARALDLRHLAELLQRRRLQRLVELLPATVLAHAAEGRHDFRCHETVEDLSVFKLGHLGIFATFNLS